MIFTFLKINAFSIATMTLVVPYLGQIAMVVFGIIGGMKGAQSIAKKIITNKMSENKDEKTN